MGKIVLNLYEMQKIVLVCSLLSLYVACAPLERKRPDVSDHTCLAGAIIRGDTTKKNLALVCTGDEYADGGIHILAVLENQKVPGSFFLTGNFYRNPKFHALIRHLKEGGHYLGAHSDQHLLYCDWEKRDSMLVSPSEFRVDLENNYKATSVFGISQKNARYFLPPYEWYNDRIAAWTGSMGLQLINYTPGTLSHADYTLPGTPEYKSSRDIYQSIMEFENNQPGGLNGFILLSHVGSSPQRGDKFYYLLDELIGELKQTGYTFVRIDELLAGP
jgi:peptidoglycan/xylan/chitin deacetylase (PgdA/CDA1 family)